MKNGIWSNSEVKELFNIVEQAKHDNMPLRRAFSMHAEKYSRMPNSVRNYYYHEIDNLKSDEKRAKKLGIDISKHQKNNIQYFSQQEEERLLASIDNLVKGGCSVRKACLTLSDGDVGQQIGDVGIVFGIQHLVRRGQAADADGVDVQLPYGEDAFEDVLLAVRIGLGEHALIPHALGARLVGVDARHDDDLVLDLLVELAEALDVVEHRFAFVRGTGPDDEQQLVRVAADDVGRELVARGLDCFERRGQRQGAEDLLRGGDQFFTLKHCLSPLASIFSDPP